jgi:hypothetical protein
MAQRYWDGFPVVLNTPAVQTNFSPASIAYWQQVYLEMAGLQTAAGMRPYIQSGEVQWWYTPKSGVGMPFYDAYTKAQFTARFGTEIRQILSNDANPADYAQEAELLPLLLGAYSAAMRAAVRAVYPDARFEILYPGDVNQPQFNKIINFPNSDWTPANLNCLKTEGFGFTGNRDLDGALGCMRINKAAGFPNSQRSHLVGVGDIQSSWMKEVDLAQAEGVESVVLFALDQYCLMGYPAPPFVSQRWSRRAA